MESIVRIKGYHTCKTDGGIHHIWKNAPFISEPNNRQWLTQGYYFWTDNCHFAHKWGENSIKGEYAIIECLIEIEKNLLLDLVGSVDDQLRFEELINIFKQRFIKTKSPETPTVSEVLAFYRRQVERTNNKDIFPYKAIKAQDKYHKSEFAFIKNSKPSYLPLVTRQQLCLFDFAVDCIKNKNIIHPESFKKDSLLFKGEKNE
ncbi:MAG: hypothetical protein WAX77_12280 [Methylococcaceae bacterium]